MPTYESIKRAADAFQQPVALEHIIAMCQRAFGERHQIIAIQELGGGGFNNTYRVELAEMQPVILRVAPRSDKLANPGEANKMRVEHLGQGFFAPIASLIPKTIMADFTRQLIDCDYMFQTYMEGEQWGQIYDTFTLDENKSLWRQLGEITRTIHAIEGPAFGPLYSGPQYNTWSQTVLADLAENIHILEEHAGLDAADLRTVQEIARINTAYLDEIDRPRLRHGDLWTVNILVKRTVEGPRISAILDADGAFWGDPLADWTIFLLQLHKPAGSEAFWEAYGRPKQTKGWRIRDLIYYCHHLGGARLECWRDHRDEAVQRSYKDIQKAIIELRELVR
jgi:aminoglycoside phosphotransferase (APT) family kinase protein